MTTRVLLIVVAMVCATALAVTWMVVSQEDPEPGFDPCFRTRSCD